MLILPIAGCAIPSLLFAKMLSHKPVITTRAFVELCRGLKLLSSDMVAIDGSKFKAVNSRDRNYTAGKIDKRQQHRSR